MTYFSDDVIAVFDGRVDDCVDRSLRQRLCSADDTQVLLEICAILGAAVYPSKSTKLALLSEFKSSKWNGNTE